MGDLVYVTYASGSFAANLPRNAWWARWFGGAKRCVLLTRADLEASAIYAEHRDVLDAPRGGGYWAWKPWAILEAMKRSKPGDILFYQDCGFGYRYKTLLRPRRLMALAREKGFVAGVLCPQYGPNRMWNRRQCLVMMGCAGRPDIEEAATVQATLSFWSNTPEARAFVEAWLGWCLQWDAVRDASVEERGGEAWDFVEHRHDQAILTNLAHSTGAPVLAVQPGTLDFAKSASMVELDLRARDSGFYRLIYRALVALAQRRRHQR